MPVSSRAPIPTTANTKTPVLSWPCITPPASLVPGQQVLDLYSVSFLLLYRCLFNPFATKKTTCLGAGGIKVSLPGPHTR